MKFTSIILLITISFLISSTLSKRERLLSKLSKGDRIKRRLETCCQLQDQVRYCTINDNYFNCTRAYATRYYAACNSYAPPELTQFTYGLTHCRSLRRLSVR